MAFDTFYWHDYETWGADPRRDRPAQFAGLRTDLDFNIVGEPLVLFARPADDFLPSPEACLVTGITPQAALAQGVCEAEFIAKINDQMARPGTCSLGYNNIRFDDEVTRFTLYRNFFDPYAREWQNGNSRWDLIDVVRLTRALRPEGIVWPDHADGRPSFRLEDLTAANEIRHESAHDALSDVWATIAVARLVRQRQPRLYDYVYAMRAKHKVADLLDLRRRQPVLHASARYPAQYCGTALVVPIARHPRNQNGILVYDLRYDPEAFFGLDAAELRRLLYAKADQLAEDEQRLPVKTVQINHCPVLAPMNTLTADAAERLDIDIAGALGRLEQLRRREDLVENVRRALTGDDREPPSDPDTALYSGGFFSDGDRRCIEQVRRAQPDELADLDLGFEDRRLPELLFRYRARNWPATLSSSERRDWDTFRRERLDIEPYLAHLQGLRSDPALPRAGLAILDELAAHAARLSEDRPAAS